MERGWIVGEEEMGLGLRLGSWLMRVCNRLTEHATNKHSKEVKDCFPNFVAAPAK